MFAIPTINSIYKVLANNCDFSLLENHQTKYQTLFCSKEILTDPYSSINYVPERSPDASYTLETLLYVKHVLFLKDGLTENQINVLKKELANKFGYDVAIVHFVKRNGEELKPMKWINSVYDQDPLSNVHEEDYFLYKTPYVEVVFQIGFIPTLMSFHEIIRDYLSVREAFMKTKYFFSSDQKFAYNPIHTKSQDGPEFVNGVTFKAYIPGLKLDKESLEDIVTSQSFQWKNISLSAGIPCEDGYKMYEIDSKNKEWKEYVSNPVVTQKESFLEVTFRA
jgi:hypothetical protein